MAKKARKSRTPDPSYFGDTEDDDETESAPAPKPEPKKKTVKKTAKKTTPRKKARALAPRKNPDAKADEQVTGEVSEDHAARPTVSLETRKLSKAQDKKLAQWRGKNKGRRLDVFLAGQVEQARKKFSSRAVMMGRDTDSLVIVIPCPSLSFEYLIAQDGFPLGLIMHLNGPPGSLKSAMLYEIFRWFRIAGGGAFLQEVETKFSPDLAKSIIGAESYEGGIVINRCEAVEEWQEGLTYWIEKMKKDLIGTKAEPGPGKTIPLVFGVDSIMGKMSWETQGKVLKEGSAGRNHPVEALSINTYMKTVPHWIDGWPFALVLNNHMKIGRDDTGREQRRTAGGSSVNFQESWELETGIRKSKIQCADWEGVQIRIRCRKNSFGVTHRDIDTRMIWWEEENSETGRWEQVTIWDWNWATVHMLSNLEGRSKARLKDIGFHLETPKTSDVDNTAWSRTLGMKKDDAKSWHDVGGMIHADQGLMMKLRVALSIKSRPLLEGDYEDQLEEARRHLP